VAEVGLRLIDEKTKGRKSHETVYLSKKNQNKKHQAKFLNKLFVSGGFHHVLSASSGLQKGTPFPPLIPIAVALVIVLKQWGLGLTR
jgi:hypothetical protein